MLAPMLTPLASAFAAKPADIAWLVSAYAVSYAVLAPLIGLLSDRIGRRRLLLPALALFAADALAVAFAPSLTFAIIARILGGAAGAALTPTAFALIAETVPEDRQAGAMGLVLFGLTLGIATGPTFAGLLTDAFDWQAPFVAVACGCLAVLVLAARILPPSVARQGRPLKASATRLLDGAILRPNLSKGFWLGATIAGFLISGEVLRSRYGLSTSMVGLSVTAFGVGLAAGNLAIGRLIAGGRTSRDHPHLRHRPHLRNAECLPGDRLEPCVGDRPSGSFGALPRASPHPPTPSFRRAEPARTPASCWHRSSGAGSDVETR